MTQMAISRKIVLTHNSNHLCETVTLTTLCCFSFYQNIVETDNIIILILYRIIAIPQFRDLFRASHFWAFLNRRHWFGYYWFFIWYYWEIKDLWPIDTLFVTIPNNWPFSISYPLHSYPIFVPVVKNSMYYVYCFSLWKHGILHSYGITTCTKLKI